MHLFSKFRIAGLVSLAMLSACQTTDSDSIPAASPCHCETTGAQWYGSVGLVAGGSDGATLVFRLDGDSTLSHASRKHVLSIQGGSKTFGEGWTFSNTSFPVNNESVYLRILSSDSSLVQAEFKVRYLDRDSVVSGIVRLRRFPDFAPGEFVDTISKTTPPVTLP